MVQIPLAAGGGGAAVAEPEFSLGGEDEAVGEPVFNIFSPEASDPNMGYQNAAVAEPSPITEQQSEPDGVTADADVTGEPETAESDDPTISNLSAAAATAAAEITKPAPPTREQLRIAAIEAVAEIGLEIDEIKGRQDRDKKRLKHLLEDLQEASAKLRDILDGRDVQQSLPLAEGGEGDTPQSFDAAAVSSPPSPESPSFAPPAKNTDESWRSVTIEELKLSEIKGFGKKKQEALAEAAPTLGALEDLRAQAGPMGLQSVLPNGFGEKICSEIEDRIIAWLSANRDRAVLSAVSAGRSDRPSAEDIADAAAAADKDPAHSEDAEFEHLQARAGELQDLLTSGAKIHVEHPEIAETGKQLAKNDEGLDACNWTAGDEQDSWLIGYLSVKTVK